MGVVIEIEEGLVTKGEFREGAHTAHGNHRSKTICRINIGVCAFDPHGPCGSNAQTPMFVRQIVFDLWFPCAVWAPSLNSPFLTRPPSSCYDSSRHIGESHWLTQPSDNKIVFLGVVFHLEAKIIKFKAGCGVCLCQCAKAFPGNIMVLLRPF